MNNKKMGPAEGTMGRMCGYAHLQEEVDNHAD